VNVVFLLSVLRLFPAVLDIFTSKLQQMEASFTAVYLKNRSSYNRWATCPFLMKKMHKNAPFRLKEAHFVQSVY